MFLASYDVNKDGVKVAVLTFPKTSYRLGETVSGIVEINPRDSRTRVLQVRKLRVKACSIALLTKYCSYRQCSRRRSHFHLH